MSDSYPLFDMYFYINYIKTVRTVKLASILLLSFFAGCSFGAGGSSYLVKTFLYPADTDALLLEEISFDQAVKLGESLGLGISPNDPSRVHLLRVLPQRTGGFSFEVKATNVALLVCLRRPQPHQPVATVITHPAALIFQSPKGARKVVFTGPCT